MKPAAYLPTPVQSKPPPGSSFCFRGGGPTCSMCCSDSSRASSSARLRPIPQVEISHGTPDLPASSPASTALTNSPPPDDLEPRTGTTRCPSASARSRVPRPDSSTPSPPVPRASSRPTARGSSRPVRIPDTRCTRPGNSSQCPRDTLALVDVHREPEEARGLNRRDRLRSMTWAKFRGSLSRFPLAPVRTVRSLYRHAAKH